MSFIRCHVRKSKGGAMFFNDLRRFKNNIALIDAKVVNKLLIARLMSKLIF
nr:Mg chelatase-related protein [Moritella viscosa]